MLQGWSTVTKKMPRRGAGYNPYFPYKANPRPQPRPPAKQQQYKRARISTGSTGSATSTGGAQTVSQLPSSDTADMTFDDFKKLTMDEKLDNLFLCVQGMRGVNERLTAT